MNYNFISKLLDNGQQPEEILAMLFKSIPKAAKKISKMLGTGFGTGEILSFLSKDSDIQNVNPSRLKAYTPEDVAKMAVLKSRMQPTPNDIARDREELDKLKGFTKGLVKQALPLAATGIGTYALSRALPTLARNLPAALGGAPIAAQGAQQAGSASQALGQAAPVAQAATQAAPVVTSAIDILKQFPAIQEKIEQLHQIGNDEKQISAYIHKFLPSEAKKIEKSGKPIEEVIKEFTSNLAPGQEQLPIPNEAEKIPLEQEKPKTSKAVLLPNGKIGELESEEDGIAKVKVDGRTQLRKAEDVIETDITEEELGKKYRELIKDIEKSTGKPVSKHVNFASYDDANKLLLYMPYGTDIQYGLEITDEQLKKLMEEAGTAIRGTSGSSLAGAWEEGTESPFGKAMTNLLQDLKKQGKTHKYKFKTISDAMGPARMSAHKQHLAEKRAETAKRKAEEEKKNPKKKKPKK